jgi:hypothetical protein
MFITLPIELTCTEPVLKILIVSFGFGINYPVICYYWCECAFAAGVIEMPPQLLKLHYLSQKPSDVLYKSLISIVSNCVSVAVNDVSVITVWYWLKMSLG